MSIEPTEAVVRERNQLRLRVAELERKLVEQRAAAKESHRESVAEAVAKEREACAQVAEEPGKWSWTPREHAAAIRNRGAK